MLSLYTYTHIIHIKSTSVFLYVTNCYSASEIMGVVYVYVRTMHIE